MEPALAHNAIPATSAVKRTHLNWDAIKLRYELMHESLADLARAFQMTPEYLTRVADNEGWQQKELPALLAPAPDAEPEALLAAARNRVEIIQIYKELAMLPILLEIESSLVSSLRHTLKDAINTKYSPKDLKVLVDAFSSLTSRQTILGSSDSDPKVPQIEMNLNIGEGGPDDKP